MYLCDVWYTVVVGAQQSGGDDVCDRGLVHGINAYVV